MKPLTPQQRELAARPEGLDLVKRIAAFQSRKLPNRFCEIYAEGLLGLVEAAGRFNAALGVRFTTYAALRITGAIRDWMRLQTPQGYRRRPGPVPVIHSANSTEVSDTKQPAARRRFLIDTLQAPDGPVGWELESLEEVHRLTQPLLERQRDALRNYLTNAGTHTMKSVGRLMGVTEGRICQLVADGLAEMRNNLSSTAAG